MGLMCLQILEGCKKDSPQIESALVDTQKVTLGNHLAASVDSSGYTVSAVISDGTLVRSVCTADDGTIYLVYDDGKFYKITPQGVRSVIATFPKKIIPIGLKLAQNGYLYSLLDSAGYYRILKMTTAGVTVAKMAIHDLKVHTPNDLAVGDDGTIYISDTGDQRIVAITPDGKSGSVLAGKAGVWKTVDGKGDKAGLAALVSLKFLKDGYLVASEAYGEYTALRKITKDGNVTTIFSMTGDPKQREPFINDFSATHRDKDMKVVASENFFLQMYIFTPTGDKTNIVHLSDKNVLSNITGENPLGIKDGPGATAQFVYMYGMAVYGNSLYVTSNGNETLRKITKN